MTTPPRSAPAFFEEMRAQMEATPRPTGRRLRWRRWPAAAARRLHLVLLGGASLGVAAIAPLLVVLLDSTAAPPAYAGHDHGRITITLNQLAARDRRALNDRFRQLGIAETVIPIRADCHSADGSGPIVMYPDPIIEDTGSARMTFSTRGGRAAPSGWHYVLAAKRISSLKVVAFIGALKDPIPTCLPYRQHRP